MVRYWILGSKETIRCSVQYFCLFYTSSMPILCSEFLGLENDSDYYKLIALKPSIVNLYQWISSICLGKEVWIYIDGDLNLKEKFCFIICAKGFLKLKK